MRFSRTVRLGTPAAPFGNTVPIPEVHAAAGRVNDCHRRAPSIRDFALIQLLHAGEQADQSGFTGTVLAEENVYLAAGMEFERYAIECDDCPENASSRCAKPPLGRNADAATRLLLLQALPVSCANAAYFAVAATEVHQGANPGRIEGRFNLDLAPSMICLRAAFKTSLQAGAEMYLVVQHSAPNRPRVESRRRCVPKLVGFQIVQHRAVVHRHQVPNDGGQQTGPYPCGVLSPITSMNHTLPPLADFCGSLPLAACRNSAPSPCPKMTSAPAPITVSVTRRPPAASE